jgi:hypothetical protein
MSMHITGRCHCGDLTYSAEIDPRDVRICHCSDCQQLSGSAFRSVAACLPGTFRVLTGAPTHYEKVADSGNLRAMWFCPRCGTQICASPSPVEHGDTLVVSIRTGTCDQREQLVPSKQQWLRSAQSWVQDIGALPGVPRQ